MRWKHLFCPRKTPFRVFIEGKATKDHTHHLHLLHVITIFSPLYLDLDDPILTLRDFS